MVAETEGKCRGCVWMTCPMSEYENRSPDRTACAFRYWRFL